MTVEFTDQKMKNLDQMLNSSCTVSVHEYVAPTIIAPDDSTVSLITIFSYDIASEETLEAIREIESGNTIRCEDEEDFFRQLKA